MSRSRLSRFCQLQLALLILRLRLALALALRPLRHLRRLASGLAQHPLCGRQQQLHMVVSADHGLQAFCQDHSAEQRAAAAVAASAAATANPAAAAGTAATATAVPAAAGKRRRPSLAVVQ